MPSSVAACCGCGERVVIEIPPIISVDDHVVEPAQVWTDRLPARYRDVGPRVERGPAMSFEFVGGTIPELRPDESRLTDYWRYEDKRIPLFRLQAAVGYPRDEVDLTTITYDDMRPGAFDPVERLADMDVNGVEASLCFPTFPRFCGQTFLEAEDRELALLCVEAYNDWMVDEWCGGSNGRLIPLCLIPLWDPALAAAEVRRNAARGVHAVCFTELPHNLGLPTIHDKHGYWEPFLAACAETATVICMHIGSGSRMPSTSPDAPAAVGSTLTFNNAMGSLADWLFSGAFVRHPSLTIAYSEGQIGWIPYVLERADTVWEHNRAWGGVADQVPEPPSSYFGGHVYGCFFSDAFGLQNLDAIGEDNVTFETDYPHSDSTWPHTQKVALDMMGHLDQATVDKICRGNAIRMLSLDR
jgi:predicted TIM-barrel fold metal-dependent hydrolase